MNGLLFTEFLEMVESQYGFVIADAVIQGAELASGGAYTAVGSYEAEELAALFHSLSTHVSTPADELMQEFGSYFFKRVLALYPELCVETQPRVSFVQEIWEILHQRRTSYRKKHAYNYQDSYVEPEKQAIMYFATSNLGSFYSGYMEACSSYLRKSFIITKAETGPGETAFTIELIDHPDPENE